MKAFLKTALICSMVIFLGGVDRGHTFEAEEKDAQDLTQLLKDTKIQETLKNLAKDPKFHQAQKEKLVSLIMGFIRKTPFRGQADFIEKGVETFASVLFDTQIQTMFVEMYSKSPTPQSKNFFYLSLGIPVLIIFYVLLLGRARPMGIFQSIFNKFATFLVIIYFQLWLILYTEPKIIARAIEILS